MAVVMAMAVVMGYMPSMQGCFVACFDEAGRKAEGRRQRKGKKATEGNGHKNAKSTQATCVQHDQSICEPLEPLGDPQGYVRP